MTPKIAAVAEGPDGLYATVDEAHRVSLWSGPGRLMSEFVVDNAVPPWPIGITCPAEGELNVVVGSQTRGVAGFGVDGAPRWYRRDIRHVEQIVALPVGRGDARSLTGVVARRGSGHALGPTGGTRYRIRGAKFLAGGPDGSVLVHDGRGIALLPAASDTRPVWRLGLDTFALLDAVVDGETLVGGADGRLRLIGADGAERWRTPYRRDLRITRVHRDPDGPGWVCLAFASGGTWGPPQVLRVGRDGVLTPVVAIEGAWIDFVDGGRALVAEDGTVATVPGA